MAAEQLAVLLLPHDLDHAALLAIHGWCSHGPERDPRGHHVVAGVLGHLLCLGGVTDIVVVHAGLCVPRIALRIDRAIRFPERFWTERHAQSLLFLEGGLDCPPQREILLQNSALGVHEE